MLSLYDPLRAIPTRYLVLLILLLFFFPAHLIHLGIAPFNGDEAIRSLVALEMDLSGNYIAPTMHGAPYINKPPLFNWILLVFFKLFGYFGEYPARTATVFFLAVYGWAVYRFTRATFGFEFAFLGPDGGYHRPVSDLRFHAGPDQYHFFGGDLHPVHEHLLFWYSGAMAAPVPGELFLMAAAFMLKGLPAVVFQGLSLTAGLIYFGQWRRLFSWQHLAGISVAAGILGGYLWAYAQYQPLEALLPNLMKESVKRTAVVFGWWKTVKHIFLFPFDSVYHFLPFSLLILAWINRHFWQRIRENKFVFFNFLMLAVNLPVYWSSVQVYARIC